ncbi:MAG TPA: PIG-L family deacetylase [Thermoanaerobaculia bacterium]|nr:PIG-L family deacetylase [Thermoanaerobaculia bacterium]
MARVHGILLLILVIATPATAARARLLLRFPSPPAVGNLLWIAAHPDDELLVAPLLELFCRERGARCTIAVATRGERGSCELPSCGPDMGQLREQELRASATRFAAAVVVGSFPDGSSWSPDEVLLAWRAKIPTVETFIDSLLDDIRPDMVLTLDPRHGSTCHPDHRAIGRAVVASASKRGVPVGVLRSKAAIVGPWDAVVIDPNLDSVAFVVDGGRSSIDGSPLWDALVDVARAHASQFSPRAVQALEGVPLHQRLLGIELLTALPPTDQCMP